VVALIHGEDEESVATGDAVRGEAIKERLERLVVGLELLHVSGFTRPVGEVCVAGGAVAVVRIGNIRVGDGNAGFLHLGDVTERDGRFHSIESGEADVAGGVLNDVACEVCHGATGLDDGVDVRRTEQAAEAVVTTWLIGQQIGTGVRGSATNWGTLRTVYADADKVREGLTGIRNDFGRFRRACAEDSRNVDGSVFQDCVGGGDSAEVAAGASEGRPRAGAILPSSLIISGAKSVAPGAGSNWGAVQ